MSWYKFSRWLDVSVFGGRGGDDYLMLRVEGLCLEAIQGPEKLPSLFFFWGGFLFITNHGIIRYNAPLKTLSFVGVTG